MFYRNFLLLILEKLLHVMTDTLHKASFAPMARSLKGICHDINTQSLLGPLSENVQGGQGPGANVEFVATKLSAFIQKKFQHLTAEVTHQFVLGLFQLADGNLSGNGNAMNGANGNMGSPGKGAMGMGMSSP